MFTVSLRSTARHPPSHATRNEAMDETGPASARATGNQLPSTKAWGMSGPVRIQEQNRTEPSVHLHLASNGNRTSARRFPVCATCTTADAANASRCSYGPSLCNNAAASSQTPPHAGGGCSGVPFTTGGGTGGKIESSASSAGLAVPFDAPPPPHPIAMASAIP